jgi:hypothetical protein
MTIAQIKHYWYDILIPTSSFKVFRHQPMTKGLTSQLFGLAAFIVILSNLSAILWHPDLFGEENVNSHDTID